MSFGIGKYRAVFVQGLIAAAVVGSSLAQASASPSAPEIISGTLKELTGINWQVLSVDDQLSFSRAYYLLQSFKEATLFKIEKTYGAPRGNPGVKEADPYCLEQGYREAELQCKEAGYARCERMAGIVKGRSIGCGESCIGVVMSEQVEVLVKGTGDGSGGSDVAVASPTP